MDVVNQVGHSIKAIHLINSTMYCKVLTLIRVLRETGNCYLTNIDFNRTDNGVILMTYQDKKIPTTYR